METLTDRTLQRLAKNAPRLLEGQDKVLGLLVPLELVAQLCKATATLDVGQCGCAPMTRALGSAQHWEVLHRTSAVKRIRRLAAACWEPYATKPRVRKRAPDLMARFSVASVFSYDRLCTEILKPFSAMLRARFCTCGQLAQSAVVYEQEQTIAYAHPHARDSVIILRRVHCLSCREQWP